MIRCTECGYKNSPVYHYCGVCGAVLKPQEEPVAAASTPASKPSPPPPAPGPPRRMVASEPEAPVSGMSFLGLSESAPSSGGRSSDYLLDDVSEEREVHWGRFLVLILILAGGCALGWQWWNGGYPFAPQTAQQTQPATAAPATPATEPAPQAEASIPGEQPSVEQPAITPDGNGSASVVPVEPATNAGASKIEPEQTPQQPAAAPPDETTEATPAEKPAAKPEQPKPVSLTKPRTPVAPAEPAVSPGESLFVQGQRYLYGTGVQEDCDRALKSLLAAASRAHPRAQSTLGAMYSTGHCVTRDLPSAYRWFAKALRQDPSNIRLQQNLEVVWRQMTPGERQTATQAR